MLTKLVGLGTVTILTTRQMQIREDTVILEDGAELSRTYHRYVLSPGEDLATQPPLVQDLAALLWTPEVVAAWQEAAARG